jgi:nucleoside-diphosphate-sugar epimerase
MSSSLAGVCDEEGNATTGYGQSKIDAEQLLLSAISSGSIEGVILRPVNVYGAGMRGNIASLISRISRGRMLPLPRLGTLISLIGVDDLCRVIAIAIESARAIGKTYILTDGQQYIVNDIESEIYRALGKRMPRWRTPRVLLYLAVVGAELVSKILGLFGVKLPTLRSVSTRTYRNLTTENLFDNSEACKELNFKPTSTFYSSLPGIVADFKSL